MRRLFLAREGAGGALDGSESHGEQQNTGLRVALYYGSLLDLSEISEELFRTFPMRDNSADWMRRLADPAQSRDDQL